MSIHYFLTIIFSHFLNFLVLLFFVCFEDTYENLMNCFGTEVGLYHPMPFQDFYMNCVECEILEAGLQ